MSTKYTLGGIGAGGHWYRRLHPFLKEKVTLTKAVGITRYEDKRKILDGYGLTKEDYYQIVHDSPIPDGFFEGVDVIHVASHNQFHERQTRNCLDHRKATVVEKTLAVNEADLNALLKDIEAAGWANHVTPHVHYLEKALTLELKNHLWPKALEQGGRLQHVSATFIEDVSEEDIRRAWLFRPENGGIMLDWIHPAAILAHVCGAHYERCEEAEGFVVNPAYDPANPTAVEARFAITGEHLAPNATATIRVGKGFPPETRYKRMRFEFENGLVLALSFTDTETEIEHGLKGTWTMAHDGKVTKGKASGPSSYELLVDEMIAMILGEGAPLTPDEIRALYRPVWLGLEATAGKANGDRAAVDQMLKRALSLDP